MHRCTSSNAIVGKKVLIIWNIDVDFEGRLNTRSCMSSLGGNRHIRLGAVFFLHKQAQSYFQSFETFLPFARIILGRKGRTRGFKFLTVVELKCINIKF